MLNSNLLTLKGLGKEELGKRGCFMGEVSTLDVDLKARHVTLEELFHAVGPRIQEDSSVSLFGKPASWWDRHCDISLLIGTFFHGLGNYEAILFDEAYPIRGKIHFNGVEDLRDSQSGTNISSITKSVNAFFEQSPIRLQDRIENIPELENPKAINKDHDVNTAVDILKHDSSSQSLGLAAFQCKIYEDLVLKPYKTGQPHLPTASLPSKDSLDFRLKQLVSFLDNPHSRNMSLLEEKDPKLQAHETLSSRLLSFLDTLGNDTTDYTASFHNHFMHQVGDGSVMQWSPLITPVKKRGAGLPKCITWHGILGLLYSDQTLVQTVESAPDIISATCMSNHEGQVSSRIMGNDNLRQCLFAAILCCGVPSASNQDDIQNNNVMIDFTKHLFLSEKDSELPISNDEAEDFINHILLPHCLHLTLNYQEDRWVSDAYPLNGVLSKSNSPKCLLPDPFRDLSQHSKSSCELATVLLRRVRLYRAILQIMKDKNIHRNELSSILKDKKLLQQNSNVPMWWIPDIHDYAMLDYASKNGLLTIAFDYRDRSHRLSGTIFEEKELETQIREFFFDHDNPRIPKFIEEKASSEEIESFIASQLEIFPAAYIIEQRLEFIVSCVCQKILNSAREGCESWIYFQTPRYE